MKLNKNLSTIDRVVRLSAGVGCIYIGFFDVSLLGGNKLLAVLVGIFGVINLFAFFTSHCPVYAACGVSTFKQDSQS